MKERNKERREGRESQHVCRLKWMKLGPGSLYYERKKKKERERRRKRIDCNVNLHRLKAKPDDVQTQLLSNIHPCFLLPQFLSFFLSPSISLSLSLLSFSVPEPEEEKETERKRKKERERRKRDQEEKTMRGRK